MSQSSDSKPIVFYLDDDEINLVLFKANLEEFFEVVVEQNPDEAIKYLHKNQVDVILTDQIMPYMDGIEFLKKINNIQSEVSRILLTGVVSQEVMLKAINQVQIYRFHEKSSNFDALKLDIDNAFQMVQAIREKDYYHKQMLETMEKYLLIAENVPAQIIRTDIDGVIKEISKDFDGMKTTDIGRNIIEFIPEDEVKSFIDSMNKVKRNKENVSIVTRAFDFYNNYKWHSTLIGSLTSNNQVTGFLMVSQDITERINYEEQIMSAVIEAEDRQKSRIARDIHDGLQQTLTISLMNFEAMGNVFELLDSKKSEKFLRGFQHLEKGLHETRNIAYSLIPKAVEDFGYIETVKDLIEDLNNSSETTFKFYTNLNNRINSQNIEYNLFRITQESINNIIKYAKASEVFIQLVLQDKILQLTIEDNGEGFNAVEKLKSGSSNFGLFNMQKRAETLSGKMIIDSAVGKGTLIFIELPLK